mmetsp:Transcript_11386/g.36122  ORF Transcript_11386/g.36122 Transcript_11386/m.36122 type:complete len:227 (-) Transcript_11386:1120-1800(-)
MSARTNLEDQDSSPFVSSFNSSTSKCPGTLRTEVAERCNGTHSGEFGSNASLLDQGSPSTSLPPAPPFASSFNSSTSKCAGTLRTEVSANCNGTRSGEFGSNESLLDQGSPSTSLPPGPGDESPPSSNLPDDCRPNSRGCCVCCKHKRGTILGRFFGLWDCNAGLREMSPEHASHGRLTCSTFGRPADSMSPFAAATLGTSSTRGTSTSLGSKAKRGLMWCGICDF